MKKILFSLSLILASSPQAFATEYIDRIECPSIDVYLTATPTTNNSNAQSIEGWVEDFRIGSSANVATAEHIQDLGNDTFKLSCKQIFPQNGEAKRIKKTVTGYDSCKIVPTQPWPDQTAFECSKSVVNPEPTGVVMIGTDSRPVPEIYYEFSCVDPSMDQFKNTAADNERANSGCQISGYNYGGYHNNFKAVWNGQCNKVSDVQCYTSQQSGGGAAPQVESKKGFFGGFNPWGW